MNQSRDKGVSNKLTALIVLYIVVGVTVAGFVLFRRSRDNNTAEVEVGTKVGEKAPGFSIQKIDGERINLSDYRGKVVILDFMATYCPPCRKEVQHLRDIRTEYSEEQVEIISIAVDSRESESMLAEFKRKYQVSWPLALSPNTAMRYKISTIPTLYMLDGEGVIFFKQVGLVSSSDLSDKIEKNSGL